MKKTVLFTILSVLISLSSCKQSNEEKIIEEFLTTSLNQDGSKTTTKIGSYTFHSFENIDVDAKFVYQILKPETPAEKGEIESQIKELINSYNKNLLYSAIAFKRSLNCTSSQWKQELEYKENSEKYADEALDYQSRAYSLGRIFNNYDTVSIHLIKAKYDYKLDNIKTEGIVSYFVYDKKENKIIKKFNSLDDEFIDYYLKSANGIELDTFGIELYDYGNLLDQKLDSLISLID